MTEPETMSYTISHFKNHDTTATQMRHMIFEKYSTKEKPWIVSDSYIHLFKIDKTEAKNRAKNWWGQEGAFVPENSGKAIETMPDEDYKTIKQYAVMEAGRERVA